LVTSGQNNTFWPFRSTFYDAPDVADLTFLETVVDGSGKLARGMAERDHNQEEPPTVIFVCDCAYFKIGNTVGT